MIKLKNFNYNELIGKSKYEVIASIGGDNNYHHNNIWYYILDINWLGRKKYLFLHFDKEVVVKVKIIKSFR